MSSAEQPVEGPAGAPAPAPDAGAPAGAPPASRSRQIWVRVILGIATVLAVFAIFAVWANRQLMNPHNWSRTSTALLQKETIRTALSGYLIDQLYANVNVPAQLQSGLPAQLRPLAGPLSGALHSVAEQGAERALAAPRVQNIWMKANYAADQALVAVVKGGGSRVQIQGGTVSLNMRQIVADIADRLGLPSGVAEKLPASVATLKVVTSSELGLFRSLAKALHALSVVLVLVVLALYALAMTLARGRRRRTLMWVGLSLIFSGLIVLVGRKVGQGQLVSAITSDASIEPAANDAYSVATSLLVQVAGAVIIVGMPVILAAWFAGPARLAVGARRFLAPHFREPPASPTGSRSACSRCARVGADSRNAQPLVDTAVPCAHRRRGPCPARADRRRVPRRAAVGSARGAFRRWASGSARRGARRAAGALLHGGRDRTALAACTSGERSTTRSTRRRSASCCRSAESRAARARPPRRPSRRPGG